MVHNNLIVTYLYLQNFCEYKRNNIIANVLLNMFTFVLAGEKGSLFR